MYNLPYSLETRFKLYLKVLPIIQESIVCLSFVFGILLIGLGSYKYLKNKKKSTIVTNKEWFDEDFITRMDNKLKTYIPETHASMTSQELEKYYDSLVTPINQDLTFDEFQHLREDDILE